MLEFVPETAARTADQWCPWCAAPCFVNSAGQCTGCGGDLVVPLPSAELPVSRVRIVAEHHLAHDVELADPAGALLPLISTPEDLARWLATVVGSHQAELEAAAFLDLKSELQDVAQHLLAELGEGEARLSRLDARIREAAVAADLPLLVTTAAGRVVELTADELVLALGEAAARGREAPAPAPLVGTPTLTHGLEALAAYEAGAPARPADPTADALRDLHAEVDRLSAEVESHQAAARRAVGLLQRAAAALRALDAEVQAGSWRGAELQLGGPLSDQTLRGLADHLEGELRRPVRG
ncbi:MAG: hypothetical protein JNM72_12255 [Deltaproteobacteria bacterium]|nr:hypothetical protein [Deltaproteobacteria bacterium]